MKIKIIFCLFFSMYAHACYASQSSDITKNYKTHHDARKLRSKGYSALYWFILSSVLYYKTCNNYPIISALCALYALDNGVNMFHYYHEAQCAACQEERAFDFLKEYIIHQGLKIQQ